MATNKVVNYELRAEENVSSAFEKVKRSLLDVEGHFGRVKAAVAGMFAGASLAGMAAMIKSVADAGDEAFKMAQKVGIGVEAWQQLAYVAKLSNVEQEALAKGIKGLSTNVLAAADGGEKAQDMFRRMGISFRDATGAIKPTQQILLDVAQRFSTMPDGIQKTAIATEIFGKAGMELIPMLNQGRAGMEALMQEAVRLGIVMDERTAASAEALNDNFHRLSAATRGVVIQGVAPLIPFMEKLSESMVKSRTEGDRLANSSKILETGLKLVGSVAIILKGTFEAIGQLIGGVAAAWIAWINFKPSESMALLKQTFADVATIADRNKVMLSELWNGTAEGAKRATTATTALGEATKSTGDKVSFFDSEMARARGALAVATAKSGSATDNLTTSERHLLEVVERPEWKKLTERQQQQVKDALNLAAAQERYNLSMVQLAAIDKEVQKEAEEAVAAQEKLYKSRLASLDDEIARYKLETEAIGKTNVQRELERIEFDRMLKLQGLGNDAQRNAINFKYDELRALALVRDAREKDLEAQQQQINLWEQIADRGSQFFGDLLMHGRSAFDSLRQMLKQFLAELIAVFAKRWILQLGASLTGSSSLAAAAANTGGNSLAGSVLNFAGSASGLTGALGGFSAGFASAGSEAALGASFVGPSATLAGGTVGMGAAMGEGYAALMSTLSAIPIYGWIAMAVLAVAAWLGGRHKGGPKYGGSFMGTFNGADFIDNLNVPGSDNGRFYTPDQMDPLLRDLATGTARTYGSLTTRLGGTAGTFGFGIGADNDPNGTAQSRVSSMLTGADGSVLYSMINRQMDDKEVPAALALEMKRELLTALQHTDFGADINKLFAGVGDVAKLTSEQIDELIGKALEMKSVIDGLKELNFNDSLDVSALQAFALEGETLSQTFLRIAGQITQFDDAFMTDAQKIDRAQSKVNDVFRDLGIAVPKSKEEFYELVHGLDLSTESGRKMFTALMGVAPAFLEVSNAADAATAALAANMDAFDQLMGSLRGPAYTAQVQGGMLDSQVDTFMASNAWTRGMSRAQFLEQLRTITREDFSHYSADNQRLILSILGLDHSLNGTTTAVTENTAAIVAGASASGHSPQEDAFEAYYKAASARRGLGDYLSGLLGNKSLSPLSPQEQLALARSQYDKTLAGAQGGDLDAIGKLQSVSDTYLQLARGMYASSSDYQKIFEYVYNADAKVAEVKGYNERMIEIQTRQASLTESVANLLERIRQESREDVGELRVAVEGVTDAIRDIRVRPERR